LRAYIDPARFLVRDAVDKNGVLGVVTAGKITGLAALSPPGWKWKRTDARE